MGFHHWRRRYEKLDCEEEVEGEGRRARPRPRWVVRRVRGLRLSGSRSKKKLKYWKAFCVVILPRRIARVYGEIAKRVKIMENVCPAIVFSSSQWGLPVLSHSTLLL
nr:TRNA-specific 2-thiouridylase [Ipomoea batatas]